MSINAVRKSEVRNSECCRSIFHNFDNMHTACATETEYDSTMYAAWLER